MKTFLTSLITFLFVFSAFSQDEILIDKYRKKVESYTRMSNTGTTLLVAGSAVTLTSIILLADGLSNISQSNSYSNDYSSSNTEVLAGIILAELGVDCIVAGIIFSKIGNRKTKEYQRKLDNLSIGFNFKSNNTGFSLAYRF